MSSMDDLRYRDTRLLRWRVVDRKGQPFDITGGSARFILKKRGQAEMSLPMTIDDRNRVSVVQDDTWLPGLYSAEVELILSDGQKITVPLPDQLRIVGDLG